MRLQIPQMKLTRHLAVCRVALPDRQRHQHIPIGPRHARLASFRHIHIHHGHTHAPCRLFHRHLRVPLQHRHHRIIRRAARLQDLRHRRIQVIHAHILRQPHALRHFFDVLRHHVRPTVRARLLPGQLWQTCQVWVGAHPCRLTRRVALIYQLRCPFPRRLARRQRSRLQSRLRSRLLLHVFLPVRFYVVWSVLPPGLGLGHRSRVTVAHIPLVVFISRRTRRDAPAGRRCRCRAEDACRGRKRGLHRVSRDSRLQGHSLRREQSP
mmetsp:Transcript_16019/g.45885  ORF Transcript_16019/g.45885 Transcript_16019/m.45885 type:complete len:266 (+) Transcript_16019:263-1060(+)